MFTFHGNTIARRSLAVYTILIMLVGMVPAFPNIAEAASNIYGPSSATVATSTPFASGSIDATGYENLEFSFDYDAEELDNGDQLSYGWSDGSTYTEIGTIEGSQESGTSTESDEIGTVSTSLPISAQVATLELQFSLTANSASDVVDLQNIVLTGDEAVATEINITNISELRAAIENQADGQTWNISAGDYGMDRFDTFAVGLDNAAAGNQTGWYFPIIADNLTIVGLGNPVIYGNEFSINGSLNSQNLITIFGDNVTIKGLTLMPKVQPNKTIEVLGEDFTIEDVIFSPNTKVPESLYDGISDPQDRADLKEWGGSLYFNHEGNHVVKDVTINNGGVYFRYSPSGTNISFDNVNIVNETNVDWINTYRYSSAFNNIGNSTSGLPLVTYVISDEKDNLDSVFSSLQDGDTVELGSNIVIDKQVSINKAIVFDGKGYAIDADFEKTSNSNNSALKVSSNNVTIKDVVIDGSNGTDLHGINLYQVTGISVDEVTTYNFRSGLVVNGSVVDVTDFISSGNTWHAINVDLGGGVAGPAILNISDTSSHNENSPTTPHIFIDDTTKDVTVNDLDGQYKFEDIGNTRIYTLLDDEKPKIEVISPTNNYLTNSDFDITVHATDNRELASIVVNFKDENNSAHIGTCLNQSVSGVTEATSTCTAEIGELGEGSFYFRTNAKDADDNISNTISQMFTFDQTGPTITVKDGSSGSNDVFTEVSFKLFDQNKVDKLTLNGVEKNLADSKWSDLNGVKPGKFGAVEGENTLVLYDVAGNTTTYIFILVIDDTPPTITVKEDMSDRLSGDDRFLEVSFKLFDEYLVDKLTLNGVEKDLTDNKWSDLNFVSPGAFGAVEGENTLVLYDVAGNTTTYVFYLIVDTEKPNVTIDTPLDGAVLPAGEITVEGTATDEDSDIEEVKFTVTEIDGIGGSYVSNVDSGTADGEEEWSFEVDLDTPGFYRLKVQAFDENGNWRYKYHDIEVKELIACTMYSDTNTVVVENNDYAELTWTHNNWTASIPGADWIWETFFVQDPETETVRTFEETFSATDITDATLYLASDNTFKVRINGVEIASSTYSNNFQTYSQKEYDVASYLNDGDNTLEIEVTNPGTEDSVAKNNPAGVLYKLVVNTVGDECSITTEPEEEVTEDGGGGSDTYEIFGFIWNDNGESGGDYEDGVDDYREGALVSIFDEESELYATTTTDSSGRYSFFVPEGTWTVDETSSDWDTEWTEEVSDDTDSDENTYTITVPAIVTQSENGFFVSLMRTIIPTAHAAVLGNFGPYNFGTVPSVFAAPTFSTGGGGGVQTFALNRGGSTANVTLPSGQIGQVLGAQTSILPNGAPNAGMGGTSTNRVNPGLMLVFLLATGLLLYRKKLSVYVG